MTPEEAVDLCTEILEQLLPDLPERAEDFRDSVKERVSDLRDWVVERNFVSDAQAEMLGNTRDACLRWLSD